MNVHMDIYIGNTFLLGNNIKCEGAKLLSKALTKNKSLIKLNLYNNNIGCEGTRMFNEALKINSSLIKLNLGNTQHKYNMLFVLIVTTY